MSIYRRSNIEIQVFLVKSKCLIPIFPILSHEKTTPKNPPETQTVADCAARARMASKRPAALADERVFGMIYNPKLEIYMIVYK